MGHGEIYVFIYLFRSVSYATALRAHVSQPVCEILEDPFILQVSSPSSSSSELQAFISFTTVMTSSTPSRPLRVVLSHSTLFNDVVFCSFSFYPFQFFLSSPLRKDARCTLASSRVVNYTLESVCVDYWDFPYRRKKA